MPPPLFWILVAGIVGLLVGSFLNVCIFRLPRNCMSIVKPRSRCPRCLRMISWYDNVPVFSWIVLRGRCRNCREPISIRYPLVELFTGGVFVFAAALHLYRAAGGGMPLLAAVFGIQVSLACAMIVCSLIDLDLRILPDEITLPGIILGLIAGLALPAWYQMDGRALPLAAIISNDHLGGLTAAALGALVGGGILYFLGIVGELIFRKEAMGFGDVKYYGFLGAFLGWEAILYSFLVACLLGSLFGIGKFVVVRRLGYVPFGPFLSLGAFAMLFFSSVVFYLRDLYLGLFLPVP